MKRRFITFTLLLCLFWDALAIYYIFWKEDLTIGLLFLVLGELVYNRHDREFYRALDNSARRARLK